MKQKVLEQTIELLDENNELTSLSIRQYKDCWSLWNDNIGAYILAGQTLEDHGDLIQLENAIRILKDKLNLKL